MAKKKYRVKKGQSFASFEDPKAVMALNPGVANLSAGQTIWVPPTPPPNPYQVLIDNKGFAPKPQPANFVTANSFMSGGQVNTGSLGSQPLSQAMLQQQMVQGGIQTLLAMNNPGALNSIGANSFYSGNQVNTQGQVIPNSVRQSGIPGTGTLNPATGTLNPATASTVGEGMIETPIGTGSVEFMSTGFMLKNIENNVSFTNQLRWDPSRGQYVKIGQLIREGKLDVRDKLARLKAPRRRGGGGGGGGQVTVTAPEVPVTQGNAVNSALSWRVG